MYGIKTYKFNLNISYDDLLALYQGVVKKLVVKSDSGLIIELDANHLRAYTTRSGIRGRFELTTSSDNKFISIKKIG